MWPLMIALGCAEAPYSVTVLGPSFAHDLNNLQQAAGSAGSTITPLPISEVSTWLGPAPDYLSEPLWRAEVRAGLDQWEWASQGRRTFHEVSVRSEAVLVLEFQDSEHSDSCDAGFSDTSLAHAFTWDSPCKAGVVHLNLDRRWVLNQSAEEESYDVRYVVMHEVGHVLGLGHDDGPGKVMSTEYAGPIHQLDQIEVAALEAVLSGDDK